MKEVVEPQGEKGRTSVESKSGGGGGVKGTGNRFEEPGGLERLRKQADFHSTEGPKLEFNLNSPPGRIHGKTGGDEPRDT